MKAALFAAACAAVVCASSQTLAAAPAAGIAPIALPADMSYPEGIAYDPTARVFYTASAADGTVVRVDLRTGRATTLTKAGVIVPAGSTAFPGPLGMKLDGRGRLWIAGGGSGRIYVVDTRSGALVANLETQATGGGLLNDLAVTPSGVYVTDTRRPVLWRVDTSGATPGQPQAWLDLASTPIGHIQGANLNGIWPTADGRGLIVVHMGKGEVYHIDIATKTVTPIDIKGESVSGGDGVLLDGRTLYVVRQPEGEIVTIALAPDLKSGQVVSRMKDPVFSYPATAAKEGDRLLVVNTQFNRRQSGDATKPFAILSVPLSRLNPAR